MPNNRVGGIIELTVAGEIQRAKGNFTYNHGRPIKEAVIGSDAAHGYKELPQIAFVEGEITNHKELNVETLLDRKDITVVLSQPNGKIFVLQDAWFAGEGSVQTEEGNIAVRFEGILGEETGVGA